MSVPTESSGWRTRRAGVRRARRGANCRSRTRTAVGEGDGVFGGGETGVRLRRGARPSRACPQVGWGSPRGQATRRRLASLLLREWQRSQRTRGYATRIHECVPAHRPGARRASIDTRRRRRGSEASESASSGCRQATRTARATARNCSARPSVVVECRRHSGLRRACLLVLVDVPRLAARGSRRASSDSRGCCSSSSRSVRSVGSVMDPATARPVPVAPPRKLLRRSACYPTV
jgi:hypothetical protein